MIGCMFYLLALLVQTGRCLLSEQHAMPTVQVEGHHPPDVNLAACDADEVARCFQQAFLEVRPMKVDNQERDCQNYQTYIYCFEMQYACNEVVLAEIASLEYKRLKGIYQPKESFLATYGAVKSQCQNPCQAGHDWSCRTKMGPAVQDKDQAIYMELGGQARQIELKLVAMHDGCAKFEANMRRWMEFRAMICPDLVQCSCQEPRLEVALRHCGVPCRDLIKKRSIYYFSTAPATCRMSWRTLAMLTTLTLVVTIFFRSELCSS